MKSQLVRMGWLGFGCVLLAGLLLMSFFAPETLSSPICPGFTKGCPEASGQWPFGNDNRGIPLLEYAMQGARIVAIPAMLSGVLVAFLAALAGLARCASMHWVDTAIQLVSEIMGALPRLVVVLVIALAVPKDWRGLMPVGMAWALMAAPGAMDEAAAVAGRLGGARFVEALKAHGFSAIRIYGYHVTWLNLRSVLVRQAAEVGMQVVFLEIALSYLSVSSKSPAFTHSDASYSWAELLYLGYQTIITSSYGSDTSLMHAFVLGLGLIGLTALMAQSFRIGARER
jgi:ABC-type dipeptide/oligopeptide/nickel transport system permease subunit